MKKFNEINPTEVVDYLNNQGYQCYEDLDASVNKEHGAIYQLKNTL